MIKILLVLALLNCSLAFSQMMGTASSASAQKVINPPAPMVLGMDMEKFDSKLRAARTFIDQGNYEEALRLLGVAIKQRKTAKLYEYFGDAYTADRNYSDAVAAYRKSFGFYITLKNRKRATVVFNTLKFYETEKTKEFNQKLAVQLRTL